MFGVRIRSKTYFKVLNSWDENAIPEPGVEVDLHYLESRPEDEKIFILTTAGHFSKTLRAMASSMVPTSERSTELQVSQGQANPEPPVQHEQAKKQYICKLGCGMPQNMH